MSPNTTPIEPSARTQKCPDEWARPSPSPLKVAGGRASFETGWDMRKGGSRGRRLPPGLQNGACLYSLIPGTGRAIFSFPDLTLGARSDRNPARLGGRSRDVLGDQPRHGGWLLHIRQMARAFDDLKPRAFDQPRSLSHQGHGGGAVLVADEAKGRRLDRAGVGPKVGAPQGAAGGEIALFRRPRQHGAKAGEFRHALAAKLRREPALEDRVGDRLDAAALDRGDALVPGFVGPDLRRRVAENERGDQLRTLTSELLRDHAADRHADDRGPVDSQGVEERGKVSRIIGHLSAVRPGFGKAVAALVISDDAEVGLQDRGDVGPDAQVAAERVDEDERRQRFRALGEIMDHEAVRFDESHGGGLLEPPRRASRKKVHQYQRRASGAPMPMTASRPGIGVEGITSIPAAAVAPTR